MEKSENPEDAEWSCGVNRTSCKIAELLRKSYIDKRIFIVSNSESVLAVWSSWEVTFALVRDFLEALSHIGELNPSKLFWMQGHCGNKGNQIADELARQLLLEQNKLML